MFAHIVLHLALTLGSIAPALPDDEVARLSYELLQGTGAVDEIEHAAFIVRTPDDSLELLRWESRGFYSASWRGPIPPGVVGVIHTHPRRRPSPSEQDRAEARRLGLPFYVVSRGALCVADDGVRCATRIPWLMRDRAMGDLALDWQTRSPGEKAIS